MATYQGKGTYSYADRVTQSLPTWSKDYVVVPQNKQSHLRSLHVNAQLYQGRLLCHLREFYADFKTPMKWIAGRGMSFTPEFMTDTGERIEVLKLVTAGFMKMCEEYYDGVIPRVEDDVDTSDDEQSESEDEGDGETDGASSLAHSY